MPPVTRERDLTIIFHFLHLFCYLNKMVNLSLSNVFSIGISVIHDDAAAQRARTNPDEMIQNKTKMRKWRAHFGVLPFVCVDILNMFNDRDICCKIDHLFWALIYLKSYSYAKNIVHSNSLTPFLFFYQLFEIPFQLIESYL